MYFLDILGHSFEIRTRTVPTLQNSSKKGFVLPVDQNLIIRAVVLELVHLHLGS